MKKIVAVLALCLCLGAALVGCSSPDKAQDQGPRILVVCFSYSGNTKAVAEEVADATGADLYEIELVEPYTEADIDYYNPDVRTTIEQNTPDARPAIAGELPDVQNYDIIFISNPIWYGKVPRVMCTFVEGVDLSGKTVVPFCTAESTDIGTIYDELKDLNADDATWVDGKRFYAGASHDEIVEWVNGLGLDLEAK